MDKLLAGIVAGYVVGVSTAIYSMMKNEQRLRERGVKLMMGSGMKREQAEHLLETLIPSRS